MIYQIQPSESSLVSQPSSSQDVSAGRLWSHDGSLKPAVQFASWSRGTPSVHCLTESTFVFLIQSLTTLYSTWDYCNSRTSVVVSSWL